MVRSTMATLITKVRLLINDPAGGSQIFADNDIQDVLDYSRQDMYNLQLIDRPTFVTGTVQWLDYFAKLGDWEDDLVLKQYLYNVVTPATSEPIAGHWHFSATTLPPVYLTGKTYDVYRAAADLLEMWASRVSLNFDFTTDGQSFRRSQAHQQLLDTALHYRMRQRSRSVAMTRSDLNGPQQQNMLSLEPGAIDYMAQG